MTRIAIDTGSRTREADLETYLDAAREERAHEDEYRWIKALRGLRVDGVPFRSRFTLRGDSLWWFAELYLHKEQAILNVFRTLAAFDALVERERPTRVRFLGGAHAAVVAGAAASRNIAYGGPRGAGATGLAVARMDARAAALAAGATLSRWRSSAPPPPAHATVAGFVHRAFWRGGRSGGAAESYIGPVLRELESMTDVRYVGIGPRSNFRARRWWEPIVPAATDAPAIVPVERYAPLAALRDARAVFARRHAVRRSLWASGELRAHAVVRGCDCWPIVKQQLAGIALLQFPWSARAMDEAAAALERLTPDAAVTYAEAGGWGRALALECRRRGVPLAGLQHGYIYRHWLNYRHETDEMGPDPVNPADLGFPRPAATLVFDEDARLHLLSAGRFPAAAIAVTGSARLDELLASMRGVTREQAARARREAGAADGRDVVLFAAKEREARHVLPSLIDAVRAMPDVQLVIKPHPAETRDVYAGAVDGTTNVHVVDGSAPLPLLLAAARGVVTVNSTVAIDALAAGVPSLVIGLPNNLSPFVEAGRMLGARSTEEIRAALGQLLYDQEFRSKLAGPTAATGSAARRSAEAILALSRR